MIEMYIYAINKPTIKPYSTVMEVCAFVNIKQEPSQLMKFDSVVNNQFHMNI